jgi:hypothetical protein
MAGVNFPWAIELDRIGKTDSKSEFKEKVNLEKRASSV